MNLETMRYESEGDLIRLLEKKRERGIFLTVLGFGMWNLNDSTMEQMADHGNGNYAYIDNQTTHDRFTKSNEGNALPGVPEHSGRIWTIYDIAGGALSGLSLQASVTFASSRAGDVPNTYEVGGYEVVDAAARYPLSDRAWLQVNVQNLFDERYFNPGTGFNEGFVTPGEPRSFFVTLDYSY